MGKTRIEPVVDTRRGGGHASVAKKYARIAKPTKMAPAVVGLRATAKRRSLQFRSLHFPSTLNAPSVCPSPRRRLRKRRSARFRLVCRREAAGSRRHDRQRARLAKTKQRVPLRFAPHLQSSAKTGTNSPDWSPLIKPLVVTWWIRVAVCCCVSGAREGGEGGRCLSSSVRRRATPPECLSVRLLFRTVLPSTRRK